MRDATKLLVYFIATVVVGALAAPLLYWGAQWLIAHGILVGLASFDFETYFHRALLIAGVILLWPLLRSISVRRKTDLALASNPRWRRHLLAGFGLSAIPLLCCGAVLVALHIYTLRPQVSFSAFATVIGAAAFVPLIEEALFRGLILGLLLRSGGKYLAIVVTSSFYSIVHFLKAPEGTSELVTWSSGFNSIAHSFSQFGEPKLVLAAFTTLFCIGLVLADARLQTRSLWLSIGLHAGWIFANGTFNRVAHREMLVMPYLGRSLLVGIVPLAVCLLTWLLVRLWLKYDAKT